MPGPKPSRKPPSWSRQPAGTASPFGSIISSRPRSKGWSSASAPSSVVSTSSSTTSGAARAQGVEQGRLGA
jgi:hypothetical protein